MLLVVAFVEVGLAVFAWNTIANAARQGARVAAVNQLADVTECDETRPIEIRPTPIGRSRAARCSPGRRSASTPRTSASSTRAATTTVVTPTLHIGCIAAVTVAYDFEI